MTSRLSIEDLTLAEAVARHGSIGAAARELLTTQPSASRRLAALERRIGTRLFDRDTTGARPTAAGRRLALQASRLLAEIDALPALVASTAEAPSLTIGTIQALSPIVFTVLDTELPDVRVRPEVDHGPELVRQVQDGLLDAAIITIAEQTNLPRGLQRTQLGVSPLVLVIPQGAAPEGSGPRPLANRTVLYSAIDAAGEVVRARLSALGAVPRLGPTIEATLRIARQRRTPAVVPLVAARWWADPGDAIRSSVPLGQVTVSLINRPPLPAVLAQALPGIAREILGADPPR